MAEPDPPRLFVYGTLMPGRLRWPLLAPFAGSCRAASVGGAIYDSGEGWPVAVFDRGHDGDEALVPGFLVDLDPASVAEALPILDHVEDTATDKLRRIVVRTTDGIDAWAYHHHLPVDGLTRIDAWHDQFVER